MERHPTQEELQEFVSDPNSPALRKWAVHVEQCPKCRQRMAITQETLQRLQTQVPDPTREDVFRARARFIHAALDSAEETWYSRLWQSIHRPAWALASVVLVAVLGLFWWTSATDSPKDPSQLSPLSDPAATTITAQPIDGKLINASEGVQLSSTGNNSDVSRLQLGTRIAMPEQAHARIQLESGDKLLLQGATATLSEATTQRVEFQLAQGDIAAWVAKRTEGQRFSIQTPLAQVDVVGTVFAVRHRKQTGSLIAVKEGRVRVFTLERESVSVLLQAGEALLVDTNGGLHPLEAEKIPLHLFELPPVANQVKASLPVSDKPVTPAVQALARVVPEAAIVDEEQVNPAETLLHQARQAQRERRFTEALGLLLQLGKEFPNTPQQQQSLYLIGENLLGAGKPEEALQALRIAERDLKQPELRGNTLYTIGYVLDSYLQRPEEASQAWERYLRDYPEGVLHEQAAAALCRNLYDSDRLELALVRCSQIANENPGSHQAPQALQRAAKAAYRLGDFDQAAQLYGRLAKQAAPALAGDALYQQSMSLLKANRAIDCVPVLRRLLTDYPDHPKAAEARGILIGLGEE